jgi:Fur family ferric uptake transcriptional regulator
VKQNLQQKAGELLKAASLRRTTPRKDVLSVLLTAHKPITQEQISKKLGPNAPDKVTIYRTLESLLNANLVHKAFLRKRSWHFELAHNCTENQCHPHFTCTDCGDTHCLTGLSVPMSKTLHKKFVIHRQQVRLEGICPKCNTNT